MLEYLSLHLHVEVGENIPHELRPHDKYMRVGLPLYSYQGKSKILKSILPGYLPFVCRLLMKSHPK